VKPYYEDDAVTLYHGDCREWSLPIACERTAVITDPPYGTALYASDVAVLDAAMLGSWLVEPDSLAAVFGWPERLVELCVQAGIAPDEWITWWPTNGRCRGFNRAGLWRESECIAVFGKANWGVLRQQRVITATVLPDSGARGKPQSDQARMGDVWRDESPNLNPNQPPRLHPNEKPLSVLRRIIQATTDSEDIVYDPFAGSGTTLRAAKDLGRGAVGIEIEERFCEIAAQRLAQEVLPMELSA
jgi:hypothetical protein